MNVYFFSLLSLPLSVALMAGIVALDELKRWKIERRK